jgi:hypothetical protein
MRVILAKSIMLMAGDNMVARLRQKPGGDDLEVLVGDMASATTGMTYSLVYLMFNTIYNILTQEGQVECLKNAARHLDEDGVFVVEAAPPWAWVRGPQFVNVQRLTSGSVALDVNQNDQATQVLDENYVSLGASGVTMDPISCRLIWPSVMDLMAQLAGLRLVQRWGGWNAERFTSSTSPAVVKPSLSDPRSPPDLPVPSPDRWR